MCEIDLTGVTPERAFGLGLRHGRLLLDLAQERHEAQRLLREILYRANNPRYAAFKSHLLKLGERAAGLPAEVGRIEQELLLEGDPS